MSDARPERRRLWKAAIKWPMYAVAVMPVLLAAGWRRSQGLPVSASQLLLFLLAAVLLLAWENLANDVFDADTGVDANGKPHSLVNLTGRRDRVAGWANGALLLGSGPAIATCLVLFCSHFHQVDEDAAHGKRSPVVRLGTARAAGLVPWFVAGSLALQWAPVLLGWWPLSAMLGAIGLPPARALIQLLGQAHDQPERITGSKFLALRFQALSGLGLAAGLAMAPWLARIGAAGFGPVQGP